MAGDEQVSVGIFVDVSWSVDVPATGMLGMMTDAREESVSVDIRDDS